MCIVVHSAQTAPIKSAALRHHLLRVEREVGRREPGGSARACGSRTRGEGCLLLQSSGFWTWPSSDAVQSSTMSGRRVRVFSRRRHSHLRSTRIDRNRRMDLYGAIAVKGGDSEHLLVRLARDISSSRPDFPSDTARSGRQGWPKAIAERLALRGPSTASSFLSRATRVCPARSVQFRQRRRYRGELAIGRASRVTNLYSADHEGRTMMQSCASAAKLRGAGPF